MENKIALKHFDGEQVMVQRSMALYDRFGLTALETVEEALKSLMLPEQTFDWKKVRFLSPEFFYVLDKEEIKREYHLDKETYRYKLTHILVGGEGTPYVHYRGSVEELPIFLKDYYNLLENGNVLESKALRTLQGKIVFATEKDVEFFEAQSFFKSTKDLEQFIDAFLKEEGSYLVSSENGYFIATTGEERRNLYFKVLDFETLEVQKGFEKFIYKINPTTAMFYQPQKQNKNF